MDPAWRVSRRYMASPKCDVVPIYFDGPPVRKCFQIASHLASHPAHGGFDQKEFPETGSIRPVPRSQSANHRQECAGPAGKGRQKAMMDFLRKATYEFVTQEPAKNPLIWGLKFEDRLRADR